MFDELAGSAAGCSEDDEVVVVMGCDCKPLAVAGSRVAGASALPTLLELLEVVDGLSELSPALERVESVDDAVAGGSDRGGDLSEAITSPSDLGRGYSTR